MSKLEGIV